MKFKSNATWGKPKEDGTVFVLKNNGLKIRIHRLIGVENTWFLSCTSLGFSQYNLREPDFTEAVCKAKTVIDGKIREFREEFNKIADDDVVELE